MEKLCKIFTRLQIFQELEVQSKKFKRKSWLDLNFLQKSQQAHIKPEIH